MSASIARPMRVLQLVQRPQRRGAEVFAYDLNRSLEAFGVEVKTVYLHSCDTEPSLPLHELDVCLDGNQQRAIERFPGIQPRLLKKVVTEISEFEPDIVQVNGSRTVKYGAAAKYLFRHPRWKLVYRNIGMPSDWHRWIGSIWIYRLAIMTKMDGVIGVSRCSLESATELYGLRVPSRVILNGISPKRLESSVDRGEFRRMQGAEPGDIIFLFVGFLDTVKRPDRFIRAMAAISGPNSGYKGWIVGEGPLRKECERLARALGIQDRLRFFGSRDDVANFMKAVDIFVMTSETEGVPAVVLEAGLSALPVVATNVGGLPECVIEGETGLLVDPDSQEQLCKALLELAEDDRRRKKMGERASAFVLRYLTIDRIALQYLDFYRFLNSNGSMSQRMHSASSIPSH